MTDEVKPEGIKMFKAELSVAHSTAFRARAAQAGKSMVEMLRTWIDVGMPLSGPVAVVGSSAEYDDKLQIILAGKQAMAAERDALKKQVGELTAQLSLAMAQKAQPGAGITKARENELLEEINLKEHLLDKANRNAELLMRTSDENLARIERLERELAQAKGAPVVQMAQPAKASVSDFDQTPEADEQRKKPVVQEAPPVVVDPNWEDPFTGGVAGKVFDPSTGKITKE